DDDLAVSQLVDHVIRSPSDRENYYVHIRIYILFTVCNINYARPVKVTGRVRRRAILAGGICTSLIREADHALDPLWCLALGADAAPARRALPPRAAPRGVGIRVRLGWRSRLVSQSDPRIPHPLVDLRRHHRSHQARNRRLPPGPPFAGRR